MCKKMLFLLTAAVVVLGLVGNASAVITEIRDSADFDEKWEGDTNDPTGYYGSGAFHPFNGSNGDIWTMFCMGDQIAEPEEPCYPGLFFSSNWGNSTALDANGWSIEIKLKLGTDYPDVPHLNLKIKDDSGEWQVVRFEPNMVETYNHNVQLLDFDMTDDFHVFRIAQEAGSDIFELYMDNEKIGEGEQMGQADNAELWWGSGSGGLAGTTYIDYIRIDYSGGYRQRIYKATIPNPEDEQTFVPLGSSLTWTAGDNAVSHDVYIGKVEADVIAGSGGTFQINQAGTTYPASGGLGLDPGTPYYWRIDEVNGATTWTGNVWSFVSWPAEATSPSPTDGNNLVDLDGTVLTWAPGGSAGSHNIYLGTDVDDVIAGTGGTSKGNQPGVTYPSSGDLDLTLGTTYYWRIDEINGVSTWTGNIWSFSVPNYLVVDDMEAYSPSNPIYNVWIDGYVNYSGSCIDISTTVVHYLRRRGEVLFDSTRSMDFGYDNRASYGGYSEGSIPMSRLATIGPDWAGEGIEAVSIWFAGEAGNDDTETMYVSIKDGDGPLGNFEVRYGDNAGEDMNHITDGDWHEWNIDLGPFATAGVNLNNVDELHIGFDDSDKLNRGSTAGGTGTVYFDDIRAYIPRCLPEHSPDGDISGPIGDSDCLVDEWDIKKMSDQWLAAPTEATGTVAWWKLGEGSGDIVADSSGYGNDGELGWDPNAPDWVVDSNATRGNCLEFNGIDNWVTVDDQAGTAPFEFGDEDLSVALWVKAPNDLDFCVIFIKGTGDYANGHSNKRYEISYDRGNGVYFACDDDDVKAQLNAGPENDPNFINDEWVFVVGVRDTLAGELRLYADGVLQASNEGAGSGGDISSPGEPVYMGGLYGLYPRGGAAWFEGRLDDVQIYDRALNDEEIIEIYNGRSIAGNWVSDLTGDDKVNFDDFAKMAADFGVEAQLFP